MDELVLQTRPSQQAVPGAAVEIQMHQTRLQSQQQQHHTTIPIIQFEEEDFDDLSLNGENSGLLHHHSIKSDAGSTSRTPVTKQGSEGSLFSRTTYKPSFAHRGSYMDYKAAEDQMAGAPLGKPTEEILTGQREDSELNQKALEKLKKRVMEIRNSDETRFALMHGLHKGLAVLIASLFFVLPYFSRFSSFPVWVAATALSVTTTYAGSSLRRCFNEAIGSAVGALLGYAFISLITFTGPYCIQCVYKPFIVSGGLFVFVFIVSSVGNKLRKWEQVGDLVNSTFLLIVGVEYLGNNPDNINTQYVFDRAAMIMAGVFVAFVTSYLIFPVKGSKRIQKGLKNVLAADFGFVIAGVIDVYSNTEIVGALSAAQTEDVRAFEVLTQVVDMKKMMDERKKVLYASASSVFGKTSQMKTLLDTTQGEVVLKKNFRPGFFPAEKFTTIIFCTNQLVYITLTLFYGLQGGGVNTKYCQLFNKQLKAISARFEKMFVTISSLLESEALYLDVLSHIQVVATLLEEIENLHRENLSNGVALRYLFDDIQAFSHLWTCLKLYVRKTIHLVDSIMRLYDA